jgi:hypothetical protein
MINPTFKKGYQAHFHENFETVDRNKLELFNCGVLQFFSRSNYCNFNSITTSFIHDSIVSSDLGLLNDFSILFDHLSIRGELH